MCIQKLSNRSQVCSAMCTVQCALCNVYCAMCTVQKSSYSKLKLLLAVLLAETADACQLIVLPATSIKH